MAFELIYKLRTKKFWWLDTILYLTLSLLIATIICYFLFSIKISHQEKKLQDLKEDIAETGTEAQKTLEKSVFEYQKKINDFVILLDAHRIPSNLFSLIEQYSLPNVWFSNFNLDAKISLTGLSGGTEDFQTLAQQIFIFQENKVIGDLKSFSANLGKEGKIIFNFNFSFPPEILKQWK